MSKKVLILGIVVVLAVAGAGTYVWVDYSQAQTSLTRSRLEVRTLGEHLDGHQDDAVHLKELYNLAKLQVDLLEKYHSTWVGKAEIVELQTALEKDKHDIDQLAGDNIK